MATGFALLLTLLANAGRPATTIPFRRHDIDRGYRAMTVVAGDFSGDGIPDVIAADFERPNVWLYLGPTFEERRLISTALSAIHAQAMDVDGDGDLDWVGGQYRPGLVAWLESTGRPGEWPLRHIDALASGGVHGVHGLLRADVDGDGRDDLIVTSNAPEGPVANSVVWYAVPPRPREVASWTRRVLAPGDATGFVHYIGFGDLDGDGRGDVVTGGKQANAFTWWRQPSDPRAAWQRRVLGGGEPGATNAIVVDLDGDGGLDVVGSRGHGRGWLWWRGPSLERRPIDETIVGAHNLAVGDLDGDGDLDVVTAGTQSAELAWFEQDGRGGFTKRSISTDQRGYDVRLVDLDRDGDLDVLVAGQDSFNVAWYETRR